MRDTATAEGRDHFSSEVIPPFRQKTRVKRLTCRLSLCLPVASASPAVRSEPRWPYRPKHPSLTTECCPLMIGGIFVVVNQGCPLRLGQHGPRWEGGRMGTTSLPTGTVTFLF